MKNPDMREIHLGTHGEDYGSWMSNPVFYMIGGLLALSVVLAVLSFTVFRLPWLGAGFFGGRRSISGPALLVRLDTQTIRFRRRWDDGADPPVPARPPGLRWQGDAAGCGLRLRRPVHRAALTWPEAQVTGIDYWGVAYGYGQPMCEKNAASEGVATRCRFQHGDAHQLDFPDDTFDAVVSNYVYHNITGADKQALLRETLRVLKPGGVFAPE